MKCLEDMNAALAEKDTAEAKAVKLEEEMKAYEDIKDAFGKLLSQFRVSHDVLESPSSIRITAQDTRVEIQHEGDAVRSFNTKTVQGKVMYAIAHELKGEPSTESDIEAAMKDNGWNHGHNTLAPEIAKLVRDGTLIRSEGKPIKYSLPSKVKLDVKN